MRIVPVAIACAALALPFAGCGGDSAMTTSTSTAPWTKAEAGKQYLAMVADGNRNIRAWAKKSPSPHNIRDYTKSIVVHQDAFVRRLASGNWPASVKPDITRLIRLSNAQRPQLVRVYTAKTESDAWAAWQTVNWGSAQDAAVADVRTQLGLPPARD